MGRRSIFQKAGAILCSLLLITFGIPTVLAQATGSTPAPAQAPPQLLTADQLDTLVAPVALYPDPLLSQVLAASTYPLEVVEAEQWLQQNENLHGQQLMDAAKRQNWDPSVQALAAFPTALRLLNNDISWTTDLGNAFLAQQADVMAAIQRMRVRAQASGKLASTPQQVVTTQTQGGQSAVVIQPANPDVMYVPIYSPYYVWGPPAWPVYGSLWYPAIGFGFGFGPPYFLSGFFVGWPGWVGWGWGFNWFGGGVFVNAPFFHNQGFAFRSYGVRGAFGGRLAWAHDPGHRVGVPYANRQVAGHFGGRFAPGPAGRFRGPGMNAARANAFRSGATGGWRSMGPGHAGPAYRGSGAHGPTYHLAAGMRAGGPAFHGGAQGYRGFAGHAAPGFRGGHSAGPAAANRGLGPGAAPHAAPHAVAPQAFAQRQGHSAPHFANRGFGGGGHAFGGAPAGGGHFGGGGGHAFGGHFGGGGGRGGGRGGGGGHGRR